MNFLNVENVQLLLYNVDMKKVPQLVFALCILLTAITIGLLPSYEDGCNLANVPNAGYMLLCVFLIGISNGIIFSNIQK